MFSCPIRLQDSDHQYLWKEIIIVLDFLHRDSNQGKITCRFGVARRAQSCLGMPRLQRVELGWYELKSNSE